MLLHALLLLIHYASAAHARSNPTCLASSRAGRGARGRGGGPGGRPGGGGGRSGGGPSVLDVPGTFLAASLVAHGSIHIVIPPHATLRARHDVRVARWWRWR